MGVELPEDVEEGRVVGTDESVWAGFGTKATEFCGSSLRLTLDWADAIGACQYPRADRKIASRDKTIPAEKVRENLIHSFENRVLSCYEEKRRERRLRNNPRKALKMNRLRMNSVCVAFFAENSFGPVRTMRRAKLLFAARAANPNESSGSTRIHSLGMSNVGANLWKRQIHSSMEVELC